MVSPSLLQSLIHKHTGEAEEVLVSDLLLTIGHVNNAPTMQFRNEAPIFIDVLYAIIGLVCPGLQGNALWDTLNNFF